LGRFQAGGYDAFIDHRRQHPSPRRVPVAKIQELVEAHGIKES